MIDILLTTYNGSLYLKNQILSLQQQTEVNWKLIIRDDGSTDDTIDIINKFILEDKRITLIHDNLGNLGPGKSFLELTKYSDGDYVIFCDQDDIWLEKKIEFLYSEAKDKFKKNSPCLIYCDGYAYCNDSGVIKYNSISIKKANSLGNFIFHNGGYQGCSCFFNKELCLLLKEYDADCIYMHDDIVSLLAHVYGDVFYLNKPLMLYRQHSENVTGNMTQGFKSLLDNIINKKTPLISQKHYNEKKAFYEKNKTKLTKEQLDIFEIYLNFPNKNTLERLFIVLKYKFKDNGSMLMFIIKNIIRKPLA